MTRTYNIKSDWSNIEKELKRLQNLPSLADKRKLDRVLKAGLAKAKSVVHIDTSSLKFSGTESSRIVGGVYRGTFKFGGVSTGINNPVDYAIYELDRGGSHDYMKASIAMMHPMWIATIKEILKP